MDLEGLAKAIAETIAIRAGMATVEEQVADVATQINSNKKEISRLQSLQVSTDSLITEKKKLQDELGELGPELDARMQELNKAGVILPLTREVSKPIVNT